MPILRRVCSAAVGEEKPVPQVAGCVVGCVAVEGHQGRGPTVLSKQLSPPPSGTDRGNLDPIFPTVDRLGNALNHLGAPRVGGDPERQSF